MKLVTPFLLLLLLLLALHPSARPTTAAARDLSNLPDSSSSTSPSTPLAWRLKLDTAGGRGGEETTTGNCWESLMELQACSGEIILFFLNGETYLGQGCCRAIRVIAHHCWPNLMDTLGFTDEESDVLEGYCDRADDDDGDDDGEDGGDGGSSTPTPTTPNIPPHDHHSPPPPAPPARVVAQSAGHDVVLPEQVRAL
ncbi:unnamed protein product [Linum tenue]|uniref:Prolamin-like domain-containing protein n=2 Tax=Linum tenue TaxID=586396 RepID=A0AAV0KQS5_9ROSI|nr:unnamed protein product [Linum tenue]